MDNTKEKQILECCQKLADAVSADPEIIKEVEKIEKGVKATQNHYGRYMALLSPYADDKLFLLGLAKGLIQAGANQIGVDSAMRLLVNNY